MGAISGYKAIDSYFENPESFDPRPFLKEVMTTSNRTFTSAFISNSPDSPELQNYETGSPVQYYDFVASVQKYDIERKVAIIEGRNQIKQGDILEFVTRDNIITKKIDDIFNIDGEKVIKVDPNKIYEIPIDAVLDEFTLIRKRNIKITDEEMANIINEQYISLGQGNQKVFSFEEAY